MRLFPDGSLYLDHVSLLHAGNYSCHAEKNDQVRQTHVLSVHGESIESASVTRHDLGSADDSEACENGR